jgi:hypothetical protein
MERVKKERLTERLRRRRREGKKGRRREKKGIPAWLPMQT